MNKDQIIEYLKENLSIEVKEDRDYYGKSVYIEVKLLLENEVISIDSFKV